MAPSNPKTYIEGFSSVRNGAVAGRHASRARELTCEAVSRGALSQTMCIVPTWSSASRDLLF